MIKKNIFFIILLIIIVGILFFGFPDRTFKNVKDTGKVFDEKKINSFKVCFDGLNHYKYKKNTDNIWIMESPFPGEADYSSIESFLKKLSKLTFDSPVSIKKTSHIDFELTDESEFIEVEENNTEVKKMLIGKKNGGLLYVRMNLEDKVYTVDSNLIVGNPDQPWKNRQILSYKKGEIVEITIEDSDYRTTEIKFIDSKWKVNGYDADQSQIEFLLAGLVNFRADKFLKPGVALPDETGKIIIRSKNGVTKELKILFLPNNDYLVKSDDSIFYLYNYRLKSFFSDPSELYSYKTLASIMTRHTKINLDEIIKEGSRRDVMLSITRPATDNTLFLDNDLKVQYGVKGTSLSRKTRNYVVFIIDGKNIIVRKRGLPIELKGVSDGCHEIVGVVCNQHGVVFRNSFSKRYFFVNKEDSAVKTPYIKIISPIESIHAVAGKIIVDFVINDISDLTSHKLFYFINDKKISLPSLKPFILENIPASVFTLKLELVDKLGIVVASDSKKLRFK